MTLSLLVLAVLPVSVARDTPAASDWTVLVYGASDNDSERSFVPDLEDLRRGLPPSGIDVVALVDRSAEYTSAPGGFGEDFSDTRLYHLTPKGMERIGGGDEFPEITTTSEFEANTGSAETLRKFIRFAKQHHPAKHYALIPYSHGGGYSFCPDEVSRDSLYTAELTQELEECDSLDLVVFDVCSMAALENAYEWRPQSGKFGVDVLVASPNAGAPFPWLPILSQVREGAGGRVAPGDLTPLKFGQLVVEGMHADRAHELGQVSEPAYARFIAGEALTCLDLTKAQAAKQALDALARSLAESDARALVEAARGAGPSSVAMNYVVPGEAGAWLDMPYYDVFDLADRLAAQRELSSSARGLAEELAHAIDDLVVASFGMSRYEGFAPGRHGIHVAFPNGELEDAYGSSHFRYLGWLSPAELGGVDHAFGAYAFCRDGATAGNGKVENWFELLDSWYDAAADTNGYRW